MIVDHHGIEASRTITAYSRGVQIENCGSRTSCVVTTSQ